MGILRKLPPSCAVPVFYCFISVAFVWRFLVGTLYGTFVICIALYTSLRIWSDTQPLSASELLLWVASLSADAKIGLASSFLTVFGFLVAFHVATRSWQQQMLAQIKAGTANEVETFFAEASRLSTDVRLYADQLVRGVEKIQAGCSFEEAYFLVQYAQGQASEFTAKRDRLVFLGIECHRLLSRNSNILFSGLKLQSALQEACDSLTQITNHVWIALPVVNLQDERCIQEFVNQVEVRRCMELSECVRNYIPILNMSSGAVRGGLLHPIVGFNGRPSSTYFVIVRYSVVRCKPIMKISANKPYMDAFRKQAKKNGI